jgi:fructosamine-3-kinase
MSALQIANSSPAAHNAFGAMSFNDTDISWQVLRGIVHDWAGTSAELAEVKPLAGGMINTTLLLTTQDNQRAVVKISPHRVNREYEREAHQLDLLRSIGVPTPQVYKLDVGSLDDPHSFILMQFIDGYNLAEAKHHCTLSQFDHLQQHLGELVSKMHDQTSPVYRRVTAEEGPSFARWPDFYRHVYDPIVKEIEHNPEIHVKQRKQIRKIHDKLDQLLAHDDCPRLVHWDIWSTNLLCTPDDSGNWRIRAVLDPMCKFAHCEAEIAYIDLFHTSTHAFTQSYQHGHRLDDTYHRVRKLIYQLYPLINHVNLYGHEYVKPMLVALERAGTLV